MISLSFIARSLGDGKHRVPQQMQKPWEHAEPKKVSKATVADSLRSDHQPPIPHYLEISELRTDNLNSNIWIG
jgi:hypothetical protein